MNYFSYLFPSSNNSHINCWFYLLFTTLGPLEKNNDSDATLNWIGSQRSDAFSHWLSLSTHVIALTDQFPTFSRYNHGYTTSKKLPNIQWRILLARPPARPPVTYIDSNLACFCRFIENVNPVHELLDRTTHFGR